MVSAAVTVLAHAASLSTARGRSCPRVSATCTEVANCGIAKHTHRQMWVLASNQQQ
ncbi:hypothetical protein PR003_g28504 [Phytophthora rubi]|uniref:Uncharacterized protein n=1 Tax=Phytophthora rubi TaxID=129364 RepID=A0A6A3GKS1_9STRA|nr:hypothetical protein PR001_g30863 [Phytophthora rubi]KAE8981702.1 hypothetical protein PR002_g23744 [Phytophthora rubi]KAE9278497.1 hypothetical protein PR003_g28504 [Phytophthora rubi]